MEITITSITCVRIKGQTDKLYLHTNLPYPFKFFNTVTKAHLQLELPQGGAEEYCRLNFPSVKLTIKS